MLTSFHALRNRNYRLYFAGQLLSTTGTGMQMTAQAWLIYRLSHSAYWLGIVFFCMQLPAFIASPFAGIIADRKDRRLVLIASAITAMIPALALAALTLSNRVTLTEIAILSVIMGIANAFEITTRHAFASDLVGKADLSSALALNSITINGSRVFGPAVAGLILGIFGDGSEGWCFFLNAVSFLAVIWGLAVIPSRPQNSATPPGGTAGTTSPLAHFREGWKHVRYNREILYLMIVATVIALIAFPYNILMPVFAKTVLQGDARTLAWLTGSAGAGAVVGGLFSAGSSEARPLHRWLMRTVALLGISMGCLGFSTRIEWSLPASFFVGFFMMGAFPRINHAIQSMVEDRMRGRVLSIYTMTFMGAMPLGNLAAGRLADHVGARAVVMGAGCVLLLLAFVLYCIESPRSVKVGV